MTIIDSISSNYEKYIKYCFAGLKADVSVFELDFSKGETDSVTIIFTEKKQLSNKQAVAILTMRLMMYGEEWTDFAAYTKEDIIRWTTFLEQHYASSKYLQSIELQRDADYYFIERLHREAEMKAIYLNTKSIDFDSFRKLCPLFAEKIINVSKSEFERLETEFYIETQQHFVLFNWSATA